MKLDDEKLLPVLLEGRAPGEHYWSRVCVIYLSETDLELIKEADSEFSEFKSRSKVRCLNSMAPDVECNLSLVALDVECKKFFAVTPEHVTDEQLTKRIDKLYLEKLFPTVMP